MPDIRPGTFALLLALVLAALAWPILSHPLPPLTDYPNNLAGAYVVSTIGADKDFQRFYTVEWRIIPNLMMDLVVPVLHRFMGIYAAGQVFMLACVGLTLTGTFALHRALFGRWSIVPIASAIIVYNEVLLVGVMNYLFGIGLSLWALAAWIALRERRLPMRLTISTVFVVALFFCHLFAVGLYGLGVLAFELQRLRANPTAPSSSQRRDFVASGLPFVAAGLLLLMSPTVSLAGGIYWELWGKFWGLMMVFTVYRYSVAALIIAGVALAIGWAARRGILRVHPFGWMLLLVGGIAYLVLPRALFDAHLADQRLPIALAFMLIAGIAIDLRERHARNILATALAALLIVRLGEVQIGWNALAPQTESALNAARAVERGARILVVHSDRDTYEAAGTISDFGLAHAASLATIERSALVSTTFAVPGKHVLQVREPFRRHVSLNDRIPPSADWLKLATAPDETGRFHWSQWHLFFDYVYVLFTRPGSPNPDPDHLLPAIEGPGFQVYRVIRAV